MWSHGSGGSWCCLGLSLNSVILCISRTSSDCIPTSDGLIEVRLLQIIKKKIHFGWNHLLTNNTQCFCFSTLPTWTQHLQIELKDIGSWGNNWLLAHETPPCSMQTGSENNHSSLMKGCWMSYWWQSKDAFMALILIHRDKQWQTEREWQMCGQDSVRSSDSL